MPTTPANISGNAKSIAHAARSLFHKNALSIGRRLTVSFLLIVVTMIAADATVFWELKQMIALTRRVGNEQHTFLALVRLRLDLGRFRTNVITLESSHDIKQFSTEAGAFRQSFLRDVEDA